MITFNCFVGSVNLWCVCSLFISSFLGYALLCEGLRTCWQAGLKDHPNLDIGNAIPLCLMCCIWKEHNSRFFEGMESLLLQLKVLLLLLKF